MVRDIQEIPYIFQLLLSQNDPFFPLRSNKANPERNILKLLQLK